MRLKNILTCLLMGVLVFVLLSDAGIGEERACGNKTVVIRMGSQDDPFVGEWAEPWAGRARLTIEEIDDGYSIFIYWSSNAAEHYEWYMTGVYNSAVDSIVCEDCQCIDVFYDNNGVEHRHVEYTDGDAAFAIIDGAIKWCDAQEDAGAEIVFTKELPWEE